MKSGQTIAMSNEFDWDTSRREASQEFLEKFDVQKAKEIIKGSPRPIELIDLEKYGDFFRDDLENVKLKEDVDWAQIDTKMPIILGRDRCGKFAIDGRHRLAKALKDGLKCIPSVCLTEEETESTRSGIRI